MKNKINILIVILLFSCIGLSIYLYIINSIPSPTISFNSETIVLNVGEETTISPIVSNLDDYTVLWTSSNNNVATVVDGKIKAINKGGSIITAVLKDYDVFDSLIVVVNEVEPKSIKLNINELELTVDDTYEFSYTLLPDNVTNKEIRWAVSDNSLLSIENGKVLALKSGMVSIRVIASNGIEDICNILIKDNVIPVSDIVIDKNTYELAVDDEISIKPVVKPDNATNKELIWTSSDANIVTVSDGKIKALKNGSATITVSDSTKAITKTIKINVKLRDKIHFIKQSVAVGSYTGDAILLESNGKFAMIDTGWNIEKDNKFIYDYLNSVGVKELEFILITHSHTDHIGGASYIVNSNIKVKKLYIKTYLGLDGGNNFSVYNGTIKAFNNKKVPIVYIEKSFTDGNSISFGNMKIELYNTPQRMSEGRFKGKNENINSVMQLVKVNNYKIFLTGDSLDGSIIESIINKIGSVDVLKLPHHGFSSCSLDEGKAKKLNPKYIVVTNIKIDECRRYFQSNIPTYYNKESSKNAVVVDLTDQIKIIS